MIPTRRIATAAALAAAVTALVAPTASAAGTGSPANGTLVPVPHSLAADGLPLGGEDARTTPSTHLHRPDTRDQVRQLTLVGLLSPVLGPATRG
ncbi:hypothetical protein [Streptomyces sp. JHA26]|uniref:hypothetical protein n=1 Tax=Streptomyces sp. JHA26 TaxID=1917143 RepID=UPI000989CC0B|nr:hypothetical protein [Streptomyces sp. JHA26]